MNGFSFPQGIFKIIGSIYTKNGEETKIDRLATPEENARLNKSDYSNTPWENMDNFNSLLVERNQLREAAEKMAEALTKIKIVGLNIDETQDEGSWTLSDIARQALADYRAKFPEGEK